MSKSLNVNVVSTSMLGTKVIRIDGFTEQELSELNSMDYREMKDVIVGEINYRGDFHDARMQRGSDLYNAWILDGHVFVEAGSDYTM